MQRPSQTQRVLALPVIRQPPARENPGAPFPQNPNPFSSLQEARKKQRPSQTQRVLALPVIRLPPTRLDGYCSRHPPTSFKCRRARSPVLSVQALSTWPRLISTSFVYLASAGSLSPTALASAASLSPPAPLATWPSHACPGTGLP